MVGEFPPEAYPAIVYPIAMLAGSAHPEAAALLDVPALGAAAAIFERFGFSLLE